MRGHTQKSKARHTVARLLFLRNCVCPLLHLQLKQVAQATLTLFVDEIFAVAEAALRVLRLLGRLTLRDGHLFALQGDGDVFGGI